MEKPKREKHNHKLTDFLKWLIFACVMLAPFFSILVRCLYVSFNQNAKDSYSDTYIQKTTLVNNPSLDMIGAKYQVNYWNGSGTSGAEYSGYIKYSSISINWYDYGASTSNTYNGFRLVYNSIQLTSGDNNNTSATLNNIWGNTLTNFTYTYESGSLVYTGLQYTGYSKLYLLTMIEDKLDNAFDYSLKQLKTNDLYNWVEDTAIYTPINAMCNGLTIANGVLPLLLTYWSLMTAIYVIFDIVIELFKKITHLLA